MERNGLRPFSRVLVTAAVLLAASSCSKGDAPRQSLAGGFDITQLALGAPVEANFRTYMRDSKMAEQDIDCMVREFFPPAADKSVPTNTVIKGSELNDAATRCHVDFSRMSRLIGA